MEFEKSFFEAECRCDFEIDEMMKRAWAAAMEVLQVVMDICDKHNIRYFADWGTLLGAVRHQGYIPWDDDIDIALLRDDYNKLIRILPKELPEGFVLTGMYASSKRLQDAAKVSQIRVMADENYWKLDEYIKRFHGFPYPRIGIDIFPLDYLSADEEFVELQKKIIHILLQYLLNWEMIKKRPDFEKKLAEIEETCNIKIDRTKDIENQLWKVEDALCAMVSKEEGQEITDFRYFVLDANYRMKKEWYAETVYLPFENIKIPAPKHYHEVLTAMYGDYMTPVKMTADHEYPFYKNQEAELKEQFAKAGIKMEILDYCKSIERVHEIKNIIKK